MKTLSRKSKSRKAKPAKAKTAPKTVLILRTASPDYTSHGGFVWPKSGPVECKDWKPTPECGNGLHGWLWGSGDWRLKASGDAIRWLVVEVAEADIIDLGSKVKFPRGVVVGDYLHWREAMAFIRVRLLKDATLQAVASKDKEHASATGNYGHASATGYSGHASATGYSGHASATGYSGHASATGDSGHASATGNSGHASATGNYGVAFGRRQAKAAMNGALIVEWCDGNRTRITVGYVGENGIKSDTWYAADTSGKLVEVK